MTLGLFACTHFGYMGVATDKLNREIDYIQSDPLSRWLHLGDSGEYITSTDKRFEIGALDPEYHVDDYIDLQVDTAIDYFHKIRKQGIGTVMGNHEESYLKYSKSNPSKRIAKALDIPFHGFTAMIRLRLQTRSSEWCPTIFAIHGDTRASTPQGQVNYLKKISAPFVTDVAVMAHVHRRGIDNSEVHLSMNEDGNDVDAESKHYAITGTFMKTYFVRGDGSAGYGEKAHYPPSALGCSSVEFHLADRVIRAKDYLS